MTALCALCDKSNLTGPFGPGNGLGPGDGTGAQPGDGKAGKH